MRSAGIGGIDETKIAETTETKSTATTSSTTSPPAPPRAPSPRTCHPTPCEHDAAFSAERIAKSFAKNSMVERWSAVSEVATVVCGSASAAMVRAVLS